MDGRIWIINLIVGDSEANGGTQTAVSTFSLWL